MSEIIPDKILQYSVLEKIGSGPNGELFRAYDDTAQRVVAIKVLSRELSEDETFANRFVYLASELTALSHPNICPIYDVERVDGSILIVQEYINGEPLDALLRVQPMNELKFFLIATQIAKALKFAHEHCLIHGNLKPSNILADKDGVPRLTDFFLHKPIDPIEDGCSGADPTGKYYIAPEQVRGEKPMASSDVFTLGAIFYEMVSGRQAFDGDTAGDIMNAILYSQPEYQDLNTHGVHGDTILLLERMLEKSQTRRLKNGSELAVNLDAIVDFERTINSRPVIISGKTRRSYLMISVLAVLLVVFWYIITTYRP